MISGLKAPFVSSSRDANSRTLGQQFNSTTFLPHHHQKTAAVASKAAAAGSSQDEDQQNQANSPAVRNIVGFIEKYDRVEAQELLSQMSSHWLLSTEDVKLPIEHPYGLISQMAPLNDDHVMLLVPYDEDVQFLDYREIHQIVRELTIGIYVLNQHPYLHLHANFDESTSCQMPPAYIDTKVGQLMINTDYWLKALWHG